jgi:hypothetical protein
MKGRKAWNKGIPMTEEAKQHLREINTDKKSNMSTEARQRMSERFAGENNPNYGGLKDETKEKISQSLTGRLWVNNGTHRTLIHQNEVQTYINMGYKLGKKF